MTDRADHLVQRGRFTDKRRRPVLQGAEQYVVGLLRRQHDDAEVGVTVSELTSESKPVVIGQDDVDSHHVGPYGGNHVRRLGSRLALGNYFNVRMLRNELVQAITDERLSVNYAEMNWHRNFPPKGC
jgi:hypothetical protein